MMPRHKKPEPLLDLVEKEGQPYVDELVYVQARRDLLTPIAIGVAAALNSKIATPPAIKTGHTRIRLRWMEPDGKGGLCPKGKQ